MEIVYDKKTKINLPHLMHYRNEEDEGGRSIVNIFEKYFSSVYIQPISQSILMSLSFNSLFSICNIDISLIGIFNKFDNLNLKLGPDSDNLSTNVVLFCHSRIYILFLQSLSTGYFPTC